MTKAFLLDIEGTTTPIDFVHKILFPYAKARIDDYVSDHFDELENEIAQIVGERLNEPEYSAPLDIRSPDSVSAYLRYLIDDDRKSPPLKSIQGMIWKQGYESGELRSIVFDDVPPAFQRWKKNGKTIAIYSSGSVLAQQLLFKHTDHGDLTLFIDRYFDTRVGAKNDADSYRTIASDLAVEPNDIVFISDVTQELDAARKAGTQTAFCVRAGNPETPADQTHPPVLSFSELE